MFQTISTSKFKKQNCNQHASGEAKKNGQQNKKQKNSAKDLKKTWAVLRQTN